MGDSFVDVTYRGLEVGRRLRMRDFTSDAAWVEAPSPMPVGTEVEVVLDNGARFHATVSRVHEQVGGGERPPGMRVRPALAGDLRAWWDRMLVESPAPPEALPRGRRTSAPPINAAANVAASVAAPVEPPVIVSPVITPPQAATPVAAVPVAMPHEETAPASDHSGPVVIDDAQNTAVMPVVDPDMLADEGGNGEVTEEGAARTTVMAAVDIEAIMEQANAAASGPVRAPSESGDIEIEVTGGDDEDVSQDGPSQDGPSGGNGQPGTASNKKKRASRRRKKK